MYQLRQTQQIDAPLEEVFAFFADPANLAKITPPWLRFRIHGESPAALSEGSRIEYRIRWAIFRLRWVTRITRWQPGRGFQDVQEKGPYKTWIHSHRFSRRGNASVVDDEVEYALPLGPLGRLAHALRVRRQLEEIFAYRRRAVEEIFGAPRSGEPSAHPPGLSP